MFKLLAIRPLEGCAPYIQKCLKTDMMYYFCNDYIIEPGSHIRRRSKNIKPLKEDFFTLVSESDYSEDNSSKEKSPTISVSAIVGMNGDGKSTLVELMMRLINNCAISYKLYVSSDNSNGEHNAEVHYNLRRVKEVRAELYYMVDNVVYRMAEENENDGTRIWRIADLNPINEKGEESMRWNVFPVEIKSVDEDPKCFFFTIVSNYSHYAYNVDDYEKEWEVLGGENNDNEKCWLHYVFHKYDGYLAPITLLPSRDRGNININIEKTISKQRLLSLFINADNPSDNPLSFRRVNGKDANILKLKEVTESKLQQKAIIDFFKVMKQKSRIDEKVFNKIEEIEKKIDGGLLFASSIDWNDGLFKLYDDLVDSVLPEYFISPLNRIIKSNDKKKKDFRVFVNDIVNWLKEANLTDILQNGDILSVINHYDDFTKKTKHFVNTVNFNFDGLVYDSKGDYKKAINAFGRAIELNPEYAEAYFNRGNAYYRMQAYSMAIDDYSQSIRICNGSKGGADLKYKAYNNEGNAYFETEDYETAIMAYTDALDFNLESAEAYYNRGNAYFETDDYEEAIMDYTNAIGLKPENAEAYYNRGNAYYRMQAYSMAIDDYSQSIRICNGSKGDADLKYKAYNNEGNAYFETEDYKKAILAYTNAISINPKGAAAYYNRGNAFIETNRNDLANEDYNKAVSLNPKYASKDSRKEILESKGYIQMGNAKLAQVPMTDGQTSKSIGVVKWNKRKQLYLEYLKKTQSLRVELKELEFVENINTIQLGRLDTLYRIIKSYGIDWKIATKDYPKLSLEEKCQHYIIYKTWSILSNYPQYRKAYQKDNTDSIREYGVALEDCIEEIKNDDQSHITRKLRQVKNFMDEGFQDGSLYERLGKKDNDTGDLLIEIDELKKHYKDKSLLLDNLPPPIYKWDILFNRKEDPAHCNIGLDSFSSGEKQKLNSIGAIVYHLQNLAHTASEVKYNNVNLIMEEIELYYHPEYQRQFFNELLIRIKGADLGNIQNINLVFVTHSPFILSDIPKCNVLFLKEGMPDDELQENTFGANIHSLLKHGFFMPNLPIGEFAYRKINALFKKLNTGDFTNDDEEKRKEELAAIYQQILLVGEPFLRNQLLLLFNAFKGSKIIPTNL